MWQRFHTEEPSDPPHEGEMIKALCGAVHRVRCLAVIEWVFITGRLMLNNESLFIVILKPCNLYLLSLFIYLRLYTNKIALKFT